jgi:DHA2 family multidrug resistance protein-like MFS transporter
MSNPSTKATARDWLGLSLLVFASLLIAADLSVLLFAIPDLSAELAPSGPQLLWIIDIYGFALAGLLITMGTLGDRIGRRRLLMIGAGLFAAASLAAAFAPSAEMLIVLRAALGIGGATMAPSTLGLIRNMFHDDRQRQTAIAIWTGGFAGGAGLGPILGGVLLQNFWWGSVFLVNLPAMLLLLVAAPFLLPESKDPNPGRFDVLSVLLSMLAVLPTIYGIKELAAYGYAVVPLASLVTGLVFALLFVIRQRLLVVPLIDLKLFAIPSFTAAVLSNAIVMFAMLGISLFNVQYMLVVLGFEPFPAALWSLTPALLVGVGIALATVLSKSLSKHVLVAAGLVIAGIGLLLIGRLTVASGLFPFLIAAAVMTVGVGMVSALANDMVMAAAPKQRAGVASALSETGTELSGATGIAILGTVGAAVYHGAMSGVVPAVLPEAVKAAAESTLGGALAAAAQLSGDAGLALIAKAQDAFMSAMSATGTSGGLVLIVAAGLVLVLSRRSVPVLSPAE